MVVGGGSKIVSNGFVSTTETLSADAVSVVLDLVRLTFSFLCLGYNSTQGSWAVGIDSDVVATVALVVHFSSSIMVVDTFSFCFEEVPGEGLVICVSSTAESVKFS